MAARYGLWDVESGNNVGFYPTQDAALAVVRRELREYGREAVLSLALDRDEPPGEGLIAEGEDLIILAESATLPLHQSDGDMHPNGGTHVTHRAERS